MKIFALETDAERLCANFCGPNERIVATIRFHGLRFAVQLVVDLFWTAVIIGLCVFVARVGVPMGYAALAGLVAWIILVFFPLLRVFLDWRFDMLLITSEKIVIVDQSSIFHQKIQHLNMENVASTHAETQFWNLFPFGSLRIELKEGVGKGITLRYIPHASRVASMISDVFVSFEQRRGVRRERE
jgi:hypothetical protein